MPQWLSDSIEMAVGLGCVMAAVGAKRAGMRLLAAALALAGAAAIAHAVLSIAT